MGLVVLLASGIAVVATLEGTNRDGMIDGINSADWVRSQPGNDTISDNSGGTTVVGAPWYHAVR